MNWKSLLNGLEFNNNLTFNEKIQSIPSINFFTFVNHRENNLRLNS